MSGYMWLGALVGLSIVTAVVCAFGFRPSKMRTAKAKRDVSTANDVSTQYDVGPADWNYSQTTPPANADMAQVVAMRNSEAMYNSAVQGTYARQAETIPLIGTSSSAFKQQHRPPKRGEFTV